MSQPQKQRLPWKMGSSSELRPENARALEMLSSAILNQAPWIEKADLALLPCPLQTNFVAFSSQLLTPSDLPSTNTWMWNQSSKSQVHTLDTMAVKMTKLIPRLRRRTPGADDPVVPSYKVWIMSTLTGVDSHFIWVERGGEPVEAFLDPINFASVAQSPSMEGIAQERDSLVCGHLGGDHMGRTSSWPRASSDRMSSNELSLDVLLNPSYLFGV